MNEMDSFNGDNPKKNKVLYGVIENIKSTSFDQIYLHHWLWKNFKLVVKFHNIEVMKNLNKYVQRVPNRMSLKSIAE